jgi:hypothetical protein
MSEALVLSCFMYVQIAVTHGSSSGKCVPTDLGPRIPQRLLQGTQSRGRD